MAIRVLFVSADQALLVAVRKGLEPAGFDVATCDSLVGLYPLVTKTEPDVLLLDAALPRLGLEASAKFLRGKGSRVPMVLYTMPPKSTGWEADVDPYRLAQQVGADDFVERGVELQALRRLLRKLAPLENPFDAPMETSENARPVATSDEGKPLVLVIDDDVTIARLLEKILSSKYAVIAVNEGASAIAECKKHSFAAVFCDLKMPSVSGPDVYRAVHALEPALSDRFVFLTAHQLDVAEAEFFIGLKNHVVHKPFSMREILNVAEAVTATAAAPPRTRP